MRAQESRKSHLGWKKNEPFSQAKKDEPFSQVDPSPHRRGVPRGPFLLTVS
jgi:hypothetical protein